MMKKKKNIMHSKVFDRFLGQQIMKFPGYFAVKNAVNEFSIPKT